MPLPMLLPVSEIHKRLRVIFPQGTPNRNLPDLILVDLGPTEPLLVFVEVVATAGPVNESRRVALLALATEAGFREEQVAFVTAYTDRDATAFKGSVSDLAWRSFAWFASEPEHIIILHQGTNAEQVHLSDLMRKLIRLHSSKLTKGIPS